jgi:hypothetical protein
MPGRGRRGANQDQAAHQRRVLHRQSLRDDRAKRMTDNIDRTQVKLLYHLCCIRCEIGNGIAIGRIAIAMPALVEREKPKMPAQQGKEGFKAAPGIGIAVQEQNRLTCLARLDEVGAPPTLQDKL